jgi:hypothetical protein
MNATTNPHCVIFYQKPKCEIQKVRSGKKVIGFDYFLDGVHAASSRWNGIGMNLIVSRGYEEYFSWDN